VKINFKNWTSV